MMGLLLVSLAHAEAPVTLRDAFVAALADNADTGDDDIAIVTSTFDDTLRRCSDPERVSFRLPRDISLSEQVTAWVQGPNCRGRITATVHVMTEVAVASADALPGEPVPLEVARVAAHTVRGDAWPITTELEALRRIERGEPITSMNARIAPDISRGQTVTLVWSDGPVRLECPGEVLAEGFVGETIKVWNPVTSVALEGVLMDAGRVRIGRTP